MSTPGIEYPTITRIILVVTFFLVLYAQTAFAQADSSGQNWWEYNTSLSPSSYFKHVFVYRTNEQPLAGYLIDVNEKSVVVQSRGENFIIPFTDVAKLTVPGRKVSGTAGIYGMIFGAYTGNLFFWTNETQSAPYLDDFSPTGFVFANLGMALLGGGISWLVAQSADKNYQSFILLGNFADRRNQELQFREYVTEVKKEKTLHISVQLSSVTPEETERSKSILMNNGFTQLYSDGYHPSSSSFNVLRKAQVAYSVMPKLSLGAAFMWLTEPRESDRSGNWVNGASTTLDISLKMLAYYVVALYEPLYGRLPEPLQWQLGWGLGLVSIDGRARGAVQVGTYPLHSSTVDEQSLSGSTFSTVLFTDFSVFLYPSLSVGLNAEYVYVNQQTIQPIRGITTGETTLKLGSSSFGLTLGLHF